jgi:hypothetical protein
MSTTRIRTSIVTLALSAVACAGVLSGCSVTRDDDNDKPQTSDVTDPTPEATPTPSQETTPSTTASASPTPTPSTTAAATPAAALLAAGELPQLNASSPWTEQRTGPAGTQPFGLCQKFDLLTIGAESAVQRTYTSGSDTAGQQVAQFPDAQNAVRAGKVIEAWHRDCAGRVKGTSVKVRPITDVAVPSGKGWSYLVSYETKGTGHFHSLGVVVSGNRMALIRMDHAGQDHDYPAGQDPVDLAVKAVAARLG